MAQGDTRAAVLRRRDAVRRAAVIERYPDLTPGDIVILNDPYSAART